MADDVVGGSFAINGGAFGDDTGNIYYYAPDSLGWMPCGLGYSQFLVWAMSEQMREFYESFRWEGWESELKPLTGDQAISIYPFLCAEGPGIKERHRGVVPVGEQWSLQLYLQRQLTED